MLRKVTATERVEDWTTLRDAAGVPVSMTMTPRFRHTLECGHVSWRKSERTLCECTECR